MPHLSPSLATAPSTPLIRPVVDEDAQDIFGLIAICYAEYPGCFVDPHDDLPDLRAPSVSYVASGGAFWAVEDERGRVCACVAVDFPETRIAELHRLYVRPDMRGQGLGSRLVRRAESHARQRGAERLSCGPTRASPRPTGSTAVSAIRRPADSASSRISRNRWSIGSRRR